MTSSVSPRFFVSTERTSWNSAVSSHCTRGRHNTSVFSKVKCRSIELLLVIASYEGLVESFTRLVNTVLGRFREEGVSMGEVNYGHSVGDYWNRVCGE